MTIDEHIGVIEDLKSAMSVCMPEPEKTEICASLSETIDIMRKYQKIEEIVSDFREYQKGISYGFGGATYMQMVSEVVEDGEID